MHAYVLRLRKRILTVVVLVLVLVLVLALVLVNATVHVRAPLQLQHARPRLLARLALLRQPLAQAAYPAPIEMEPTAAVRLHTSLHGDGLWLRAYG